VRLLLIVCAAVLVAGCSTQVEPPPPAAIGAERSGLVSPPRPRELPLDGVDPCALLTPAQRTDLGLDGGSVPYRSAVPKAIGPACSISGSEPRAVNVGFALVTGSGIEAITAPGAVTDELTPITVAGFPAVIARPGNPDGCFVDVDVAHGQLLDVIFRDGGRKPPIPQEQLCRDAVQVAEQAMRTLLAD
jgi:hypothetical protein